jgi:acetylornithine deacetylase/succinyl-diaminopimelate desuccinylase-like protein
VLSIDWKALGDETADLLRRYLMIDTTNPPGNEIAGARFLADVLEDEGIRSETVESAPGRANLVARLGGDGSLPGIVLHHTSTSSTPTAATGRWTRSAA